MKLIGNRMGEDELTEMSHDRRQMGQISANISLIRLVRLRISLTRMRLSADRRSVGRRYPKYLPG